MNNRELFQKYLDNELSDKEKSGIMELLKTDPEAYCTFQSMNNTRTKVLETLDLLNPQHVEIPPRFIQPKQFNKTTWSIAALIIILIGVSGILWISNRSSDNAIEEIVINEGMSEEAITSELDHYISPNRSWKKRELTWTFYEFNKK